MRSRLERATEKRDDEKEYLARWAFGMRLSERRERQRRIDKLDAKVQRLSGQERGQDG